jgi:2-polyprenyl-6-methoxyphenol hydroxylase-like FAD-dependent oxidoreductase
MVGSSFAIEDATILANSLANHPSGSSDGIDFRPPLEEYARLRVPRSKKMAKMAYYAGLFGLGERWYWRWLRDFGTTWVPTGEDKKLCVKFAMFTKTVLTCQQK